MKRTDKKSDCAINYSLEQIGDPWSLLIVRDIVFFGKSTYGEFLASDERIGTSVLARRLLELERAGILVKKPLTTDGRKDTYCLTEKGLGLIPLLLDLTEWGSEHDPETGADQRVVAQLKTSRTAAIRQFRKSVQIAGLVA